MAKKKIQTTLEKVALADIKKDKRNPKKHYDEGIDPRQSLQARQAQAVV